VLGCALAGSVALAATPAHAVPRASTSASVPCIKPTSRPTKWRASADTERVSARTSAEVTAVVASAARSATMRASRADATGQARAAAPGHIVVPVLIHLIHGRHRHEHRISKRAARRMFYTLKAGYAGAQDPASGPTGVSFVLKKITVTRNEAWYHAAPYSRADKQMKNRLHRGRARVLNIYVNRPRSYGAPLLGFSVFPWQHRSRPKLDGVTVSDVSLPGGAAAGYNLGDTVIHETGHWLGLLHTFEGGCEDRDGVADTPAEAQASFRCDERNTCDTPIFVDPANPTGPAIDLPDPIHNFMDYSYDFCMYQFTPGQDARMIALFMHYRYGRR